MEKEAKMKARTICIILALMLAFGIAVHALAAGRPNPGVEGYKVIGPSVKGILIVGWKVDEQVDAFLHIDGQLYASVLGAPNQPEGYPPTTISEDQFLIALPADVLTWPFPSKIAEYYNMPSNTVVRVLTEKDVMKFSLIQHIDNENETNIPYSTLSYKHMIHCEVKLSFLIPK